MLTAAAPAREPMLWHGIIGDIALGAEDYTEADPVGILAAVVAAAGVIIGPGPHVMISFTRHPTLVWPLLFGESGSGRKGEAQSTAERFVRRASPEFEQLRKSGLSSGEGVIEAIRDEQEIGVGVFTGTSDKRLLIVESEFASVLARAKREGSTLSPILRQLWEGDSLRVLNRTQMIASSSHVGIIGHITPDEFRARKVQSDQAGGLYNRFITVYVARSRKLALPPQMPRAEFDALASSLGAALTRAKTVGEVSLSTEAELLWKEELYDDLSDEEGPDRAADELTRRLATYCRRISALYAALDGRSRVNVDDLRAAGALCRYSRQSAHFVLGTARRNTRVDTVIRALDETPGGLGRDEIRDRLGHHLKADQLDQVLGEVMQDPAISVEVDRETGGRPRHTYRSARACRPEVVAA